MDLSSAPKPAFSPVRKNPFSPCSPSQFPSAANANHDRRIQSASCRIYIGQELGPGLSWFQSAVGYRRPASGRNRRGKACKEEILNALLSPYQRAHHRFATFTAAATFLLIVAGALVTSNDAGLSVPDWPTSFGHSPISYSYFRVPLVGGVKYEHGHRMVAEMIGLLTIVLAIWTWRSYRRCWIRYLGVAALGAVIVQGIFGGLTVLLHLPAIVSTAHAALGQAFFCLAVSLALLTSRQNIERETLPQLDGRKPSLPQLAWLSVAVVYLQLILGAMFRHHGMRLLPHLIVAALVTACLLWTTTRTLACHREIGPLRTPATVLLLLLFVQLALGFASYIARVVWSQAAVATTTTAVAVTVAHVSVGALVLATTVVVAIQASRHISVAAETQGLSEFDPKAWHAGSHRTPGKVVNA